MSFEEAERIFFQHDASEVMNKQHGMAAFKAQVSITNDVMQMTENGPPPSVGLHSQSKRTWLRFFHADHRIFTFPSQLLSYQALENPHQHSGPDVTSLGLALFWRAGRLI